MVASRRSFAERILNRFGAFSKRQIDGMSKRSFAFAAANRLTADWMASGLSGNSELRGPVRTIIHRARDLAHENDYVRGFLQDVESNVIGSAEFDLRMEAGDMVRGRKQLDAMANVLIENAWAEWCRPANCSIAGDVDWRGVKRLALRDVPVAGAVLCRHVRGAAAGNRFGYAVQLIEVEQLALEKHGIDQGVNVVRFGIEKTPRGRTVAYHIYLQHPGEDLAQMQRGGTERIPAGDVILLQIPERISQVLSMTWFISSGKSLKMLDGYEDAELVAARAGACKGGWFETPQDGGTGYPGPKNDNEQMTVDAEPGVWESLPAGVKAVVNDPSHPNTAFGEFRKAVLRRISTSLGISYTTLGNDLEAVNFSSARVGLMDEREVWKAIQLWFRVHMLEPVFTEWLTMALTTGAINLPLAKFDKFNQPRFKPRRWDWLEPLKDAQAKTLAVEKGFTSRRAVIDEQGGDIEIVFADQDEDAKLAAKHGLSFATTPGPGRPVVEPDEDEGKPGAKD